MAKPISNNSEEKRKKLRRIEIKTRKLSNQIFSGSYHSAFKGRGISFSEVREYQYGDDIRSIDWNVTARNNRPFVKVFEEERELTVMLLIDVSQSSFFGTRNDFKNHIIAEISAILAFSAITNNDKVGVIFFSDKVEQYIPPKKGKSHILRIIREFIQVPLIVDAGVGTASDAALAMELGADGVLMNTAIAGAQEPARMAEAMKLAEPQLMKAAQTGQVHKNTASRKISRLTKSIAKLGARPPSSIATPIVRVSAP